MRPGGAFGWPLIKPAIDGVELGTELAPDVEPPITDEDRLAELRAVGAEKRRLPAVNVAVMPGLTPRLDVGEEAGVRLIVAIKICVWHLAQDWVIHSWPTCGYYWFVSHEDLEDLKGSLEDV